MRSFTAFRMTRFDILVRLYPYFEFWTLHFDGLSDQNLELLIRFRLAAENDPGGEQDDLEIKVESPAFNVLDIKLYTLFKL